jgi:hypothetical protein
VRTPPSTILEAIRTRRPDAASKFARSCSGETRK